MKAGWRNAPLGEIAVIQKKQGGAKPLPYVGLEDIGSGGSGRFLGTLSPQSDKSTTFEFGPVHLLYGRLRPYLNKVLLPNFEGHCSSEIFPILPSAQLDRSFLFYWLTHQPTVDAINETCTGARMPRANMPELMKFTIPLPPLEEQKRIVAVLDEAFEGLDRARANAEANLADARELFAGYMQSVFSGLAQNYDCQKITDVADHCLGKMLDKNKNTGTPRRYLRNINVRWFTIDTGDMLEMKIEDREANRYSAVKGDLLICEGGYPGRSAIWEGDEPVFFQKALHRVRFSNPSYGKLLMFYLYLLDSTGRLEAHFTGSGIQHFTGQSLGRLKMPMPDSDTVERITAAIQSIQSEVNVLERAYKATMTNLDLLRQSLLQKAFSGELT